MAYVSIPYEPIKIKISTIIIIKSWPMKFVMLQGMLQPSML